MQNNLFPIITRIVNYTLETPVKFVRKFKREKVHKEKKTKLQAMLDSIEFERTGKTQETVEEEIRHYWKEELSLLEMTGAITFYNKQHKGRMRGKDIAMLAHHDWRRIGISTKMFFTDSGARLEKGI